MGKKIKSFSDGSYLKYGQGSFDEWCIYFTQKDGTSYAPRDEDYFTWLKQLADNHGVTETYDDYVRIYNQTGKQVEESVLDEISEIAASYGRDALKADVTFSILYMAMIAEEQRKNTRLGKRIKRLGVHKLLIENSSASEAASFMCDMKWEKIAKLCWERGF